MLALFAAFWLSAAPAPVPPPAIADLVDATEVVPGLVLDIRYATANNFLHQRLYDSARCLLRPRVAGRLAKRT